MKTKRLGMVVELTEPELAALNTRAERERRLPYQTASLILARSLRRELREAQQMADNRQVQPVPA